MIIEMKKRGNKAQSQIITTVLIILLVLAAIVIVWQVINKTVKESSSDIPVKMSMVQSNLKVEDVDAATNTIKIKRLGGSSDIEVIGMKFIVNGEVVNASPVSEGSLKPLETREWTLDTDIQAGDKIEIVPIFNDTNTGKEVAGNVADSVVITSSGSEEGGDEGVQCSPGDSCTTSNGYVGTCDDNENCIAIDLLEGAGSFDNESEWYLFQFNITGRAEFYGMKIDSKYLCRQGAIILNKSISIKSNTNYLLNYDIIYTQNYSNGEYMNCYGRVGNGTISYLNVTSIGNRKNITLTSADSNEFKEEFKVYCGCSGSNAFFSDNSTTLKMDNLKLYEISSN